MPAAADAWVPHAAGDSGASSFDVPEVTFFESDLLPDYASARRGIGRILPLQYTTDRDVHAVLPAPGKLRATTYRETPQ